MQNNFHLLSCRIAGYCFYNLQSGYLADAFIQRDLDRLIHTLTHRRRSQPCKATSTCCMNAWIAWSSKHESKAEGSLSTSVQDDAPDWSNLQESCGGWLKLRHRTQFAVIGWCCVEVANRNVEKSWRVCSSCSTNDGFNIWGSASPLCVRMCVVTEVHSGLNLCDLYSNYYIM